MQEILIQSSRREGVFSDNSGYFFFLILHNNVCCDPLSEPSRRNGSDEGSQHIISMKKTEIIPQLSSNISSYMEIWVLLSWQQWWQLRQQW